MKKKNKNNLPLDIFKNIPHEKIPSDVLGSYIGVDENGDVPEQDADDL